MKRLGALKGSGKKGYYNFMAQDSKIHSDSANGIKQPQIKSDAFMRVVARPKKILKDLGDGKYEYRGYHISIEQDPEPQSPREWDNLGHMVVFHKRYSLGDKTDLKSDMFHDWADLEFYMVKEYNAVIVLPIYLYDHSGITMSTKSFNDRWDSGQVGYIYATKEDVEREYGKATKENIEKARNVLQNEVKTYDQYLTGDVWGYQVDETGDSTWGYYSEKDALDEAKSIVDYQVTHTPPSYKQKTLTVNP